MRGLTYWQLERTNAWHLRKHLSNKVNNFKDIWLKFAVPVEFIDTTWNCYKLFSNLADTVHSPETKGLSFPHGCHGDMMTMAAEAGGGSQYNADP